MMERSKLFLTVAATLVVACERPTGPSTGNLDALATSSTSATTFSGEATVIQAEVTPPAALGPVAVKLVETGKLPESGGALDATLLEVNITKEQTAQILALSAIVGHASTVGQGKRSRAKATVADLSINVGGTTIEASFLKAVADAACDAVGGATATGGSTIADLVINGQSYSIGTGPDQEIVNLGALKVVANEQRRGAGNANDADITVNALHVTVYAVDLAGGRGAQLADIVIASAHADIHCGGCVDAGDDFTTGGGWFNAGDPPGARKHFAVAGGFKNGRWWGHLTYMDKGENLRVKGDEVTLYQHTETGDLIEGNGHFADGTPVTYRVMVKDNGEPGDADTFHIWLNGAPAGGGVLGGGNIQFHDKPGGCAQ